MKKLCKTVVSGVLAASVVLSSVGVSYAMPMWDDAANKSNLAFNSNRIGTADVDFVDQEHEVSETLTVSILPTNGTIWIDSSLSKAGLDDIRLSYSVLYMSDSPDSQAMNYVDGIDDSYFIEDITLEFDKEYKLYDLYNNTDFSWRNVQNTQDLISRPHVFIIEIWGKDGTSVLSRYSYFQGFNTMTGTIEDSASSPSTSWKSDSNGWWVERSDGSYLTNEWYQSENGLWYYMGADGYMLTNTTTPDGYMINTDGVWVQ